MNTNLYGLLDVSTNADDATIKQAAQKRLQTFKQAYKILSSTEKRPLYDARYAKQADNFYVILNVAKDADIDCIKQAVQDRAEEVKQAYAILSNPQKRAAYDQTQQATSIQTQPPIILAEPEHPKQQPANIEEKAKPVETTTPLPAPKEKQKSSFIGRIFKFAAITVVVLIVLLSLTILGVYFLFNPNDYKQEIETLVKQQTEREFKLDGELKLSIYPWVGLELNQARLGNAAGFTDVEFAKIDSLQVKVKLLPLLSKQIEMDTLSLIGANIHLTRLSDGRTNWDDLITKYARPKETTTPEKPASFDLTQLHIGGINIQNTALKWDDQQTQQVITLSNTGLKIGAIALPEPISIALEGHLNLAQPAPTDLQLTLTSQVQFNPASGQLEIRDLNWDSHIQSTLVPQGQQVKLQLQQLSLQQMEQNLSIKDLMLSALGMNLHTDVSVLDFSTKPNINGKVRIDNFNPREVLKNLGQAALPDSQFLQTASLGFDFNAQMDNGNVQINDVTLKVDDNQLLMPQFLWNMQQNTMQMDKLSLQVADLKADAQLQMTSLLGVNELQGNLEIQPFNVKNLLAKLGLPALETQDVNALNHVAFKTQLAGDFDTIKFNNLQLSLDDSQVLGLVQLKPATQAVTFDLSLEHLNLDRYLPPNKQSTAAAEKPSAAELPLEQLQKLNLDGKFVLHTLQVQGQQIQNMQLGVFAENGDIKLSYQQNYQGLKSNTRLLLDAKQEPAKLNLKQDIQESTVGGSNVSLESNLTLQRNLQFNGDLTLSVDKLRQLLQKLQISLPAMQDNNTLHSFTLNAQGLSGDLQNLAAQHLQIDLDETKVNGHFNLQNFAQPALTFDLHVDQFNLDRYLPIASNAPEPPSSKEVEQALPLEALRQLNINGVVQLDKLQAKKLHLQNLKIEVTGKEGDIRLKNALSLYQGQLQADVHLNAQQTPVKLSLKKQLSGLQAEPLFNDLQDGKGLLKGQANFAADLTATGTRPQDLIDSLSGDIQFNFANGAIKGFDLDATIATAKAALGKGKPPASKGKNAELETSFAELKGTMKLSNGNLHTDSINLTAPYLQFSGSGDVALSTKSIDYRLAVTVLDKKAVDAGKASAGITLPVTLTGELPKPKINLDLKGLLTQQAEHQLGEEIEKRGDALKEKAQEKVLDKLRGLF